jgi:8-oxo-dGTP diphosphatase
MDFTYYLTGIKVEVYVGRLNKETVVYCDENDLEWIGVNQNFFDVTRFAGEGNIGHIMKQICLSKELNVKEPDVNNILLSEE